MQINELRQRLKERDIQLNVGDKALSHIAALGFDPNFGARPLKRTIQRELENPLAQAILSEKFLSGDTVQVGISKDKLVFRRK